MYIKDIMTKNVVSVSQDYDIQTVAELMKKHNIGAVPVCLEENVIGIITDRDIVLRAIATGKDTSRLTAKDVMTLNPVIASPDTEVKEAAKLMSSKKIRRLPIVSGDKLVGIVSLGDISVDPNLNRNAEKILENVSQPSTPRFVQ